MTVSPAPMSLADLIQVTVDAAPPLTAEQRADLRPILAAGHRQAIEQPAEPVQVETVKAA